MVTPKASDRWAEASDRCTEASDRFAEGHRFDFCRELRLDFFLSRARDQSRLPAAFWENEPAGTREIGGNRA